MKYIYRNWILPFLAPIILLIVAIACTTFLPKETLFPSWKNFLILSVITLLAWRVLHKKFLQRSWSNWISWLFFLVVVFAAIGSNKYTQSWLLWNKENIVTRINPNKNAKEKNKNIAPVVKTDTAKFFWSSKPAGMLLRRIINKDDERTLYFDDTTIVIEKEDKVFASLKIGDIVFISNNNGLMSMKLLGENKTYFCGPEDAVCSKKDTFKKETKKQAGLPAQKREIRRLAGKDYTKGMSLDQWNSLPEDEKQKYIQESKKIALQNKQGTQHKSLR